MLNTRSGCRREGRNRKATVANAQGTTGPTRSCVSLRCSVDTRNHANTPSSPSSPSSHRSLREFRESHAFSDVPKRSRLSSSSQLGSPSRGRSHHTSHILKSNEPYSAIGNRIRKTPLSDVAMSGDVLPRYYGRVMHSDRMRNEELGTSEYLRGCQHASPWAGS